MNENILITSKTRKGNSACVGGIILSTKEFVRLLNPGNWDQPVDTHFNIGDIWNIEYDKRVNVIPLHVEDIIVRNKSFVRKINDLSNFIIDLGVPIYLGSPIKIFDGKLKWTLQGSGYINDKNNLPENSVGFWIPDGDLILDIDKKHYLYLGKMSHHSVKRFPYVGFGPKVPKIPSGTLIRISLARWWKPVDIEMEERCYLQLSGWYGTSNSNR